MLVLDDQPRWRLRLDCGLVGYRWLRQRGDGIARSVMRGDLTRSVLMRTLLRLERGHDREAVCCDCCGTNYQRKPHQQGKNTALLVDRRFGYNLRIEPRPRPCAPIDPTTASLQIG